MVGASLGLGFSELGIQHLQVPKHNTQALHANPDTNETDYREFLKNFLRALSSGGFALSAYLLTAQMRKDYQCTKPDCLHKGFLDLIDKSLKALNDSKALMQIGIDDDTYTIKLEDSLRAIFTYSNELFKMLPANIRFTDRECLILAKLDELASKFLNFRLQAYAQPNHPCTELINQGLDDFDRHFALVSAATNTNNQNKLANIKEYITRITLGAIHTLGSKHFYQSGETKKDRLSLELQAFYEGLVIPKVLKNYTIKLRNSTEASIEIKTYDPQNQTCLHPGLREYTDIGVTKLDEGWYRINHMTWDTRFKESISATTSN